MVGVIEYRYWLIKIYKNVERGCIMKSIKIVFIVVILLLIPFNTVYAKWAYNFVVYDKNVYIITDRTVDTELIGSKLGQVTKYSSHEGTYSGNFSNTYPKGTKYYKIIGTDVNKAIAVKEIDGTFIEAKFDGEYAGARYDIQTFLLYSIGLIILVIIVWRLVRKKIFKS
jgi:hypothetical protein